MQQSNSAPRRLREPLYFKVETFELLESLAGDFEPETKRRIPRPRGEALWALIRPWLTNTPEGQRAREKFQRGSLTRPLNELHRETERLFLEAHAHIYNVHNGRPRGTDYKTQRREQLADFIDEALRLYAAAKRHARRAG